MIRRDAPELSVPSTNMEIGGPPGRLKGTFNRVDGGVGRGPRMKRRLGIRFAPGLSARLVAGGVGR